MGLRAYSMLNLMVGRRVRSEAFWPDPSEEEENGRSVGRDEDRLSCVGPEARWLGEGDDRRARSQSAWFEATDDARKGAKARDSPRGPGPKACGDGASRSASPAGFDLDVRCWY